MSLHSSYWNKNLKVGSSCFLIENIIVFPLAISSSYEINLLFFISAKAQTFVLVLVGIYSGI